MGRRPGRNFIPLGKFPPAREGCAGLYDAAHDAFVIFSGYDPTTTTMTCGHTIFTPARVGRNWTPAGTPPSPRMLGLALYDAGNQHLVVSGGIASPTIPSTP